MTEADLQAVVDLTIEAITTNPPTRQGRPISVTTPPKPKVEVRSIRGGYAKYRLNLIVIPAWALKEGDSHAIWYAVHEASHFLNPERRHGHTFEDIENVGLRLWDIRISRRSRVYPTKLVAVSNGSTLWERRH